MGAGRRRGAHERAGSRSERVASAVRWNSVDGRAFAGSSTALELVLGAGAIAGFEAGDLVACDVDYAQQVGYVGTGIAAAYVKNPADVLRDANYVRRVTFNVGRVAQVMATSLLLRQALPGSAGGGGVGAAGESLLWTARAGRFCNSVGLFVAEDESGGRCVSSIRF